MQLTMFDFPVGRPIRLYRDVRKHNGYILLRGLRGKIVGWNYNDDYTCDVLFAGNMPQNINLEEIPLMDSVTLDDIEPDGSFVSFYAHNNCLSIYSETEHIGSWCVNELLNPDNLKRLINTIIEQQVKHKVE